MFQDRISAAQNLLKQLRSKKSDVAKLTSQMEELQGALISLANLTIDERRRKTLRSGSSK